MDQNLNTLLKLCHEELRQFWRQVLAIIFILVLYFIKPANVMQMRVSVWQQVQDAGSGSFIPQ